MEKATETTLNEPETTVHLQSARESEIASVRVVNLASLYDN